ncbi:Isopenicillin N synthase-like, Fe(2+) 2OG dioxygenase domain [Dillenia turbinata]|uniref:Isopenicillin N synthase-like, Fe(2+) 2OG dioxygenase domain n=1 Tax=Dillenia turbinata TaxID=194707 RepID=A0AAN8V4I9_9MAGN
MMKKGRHSRLLTSRKPSSSTLFLSILLIFSFLAIILLVFGILSNSSSPSSNSPSSHRVNDLASIVHSTTDTDIDDGFAFDRSTERWTEVISWEPRAFVYHSFLTKDECEYLIELAKPYMKKSTVVDNNTGKSMDSRVRTSSGTFLARGQDKIIRDIEKRIADFTFIPVDFISHVKAPLPAMATALYRTIKYLAETLSKHGEGLQVLHYEVGQKYEPHFDYFVDEFNTKNGGQRMATLLMYLRISGPCWPSLPGVLIPEYILLLPQPLSLSVSLSYSSDVEEGGETVFPAAKGNFSSVPWYDELSECGKQGLSIKPKRGDALLFWSMRPDASQDPSSLHGACPVIKGNKWSSVKWMRVHEYKT